MGTTDRDYADKSWLRQEPDSFQLLDPQFAGALIFAGLAAALVLERMHIL